jgi:PAS domain S-box-containing protein
MGGKTILVVEDNPITRKMVRLALESDGYEVIEAGDGRSALKLAADRHPDLVVQDYVLPDMDGLHLLHKLRELPGEAAIPILLVTGMASQIEELRLQAAGPTTVLPKPLEPSRMLEIVHGYLTADQPSVGRGRRILVVDDEVLGRKLAALRLLDAGFEVESASDGEEALRKAHASPPDAILSDVLMPGINGFAFCKAVREDGRLSRVPVVLLSSAFVEEPDRQLALQMGASALLARTPDFGDAVAALVEALERGTPPPPPSAPDVESLHAQRVQVQLEKQVARNEALLRQGAIQAAALSVVRGLAQALANPRDIVGMLGDVLVHCLDAAGLSTGLLYLLRPDGGLRLQAQAGLPSAAREPASRCFDHPEVLQGALDAGQPLAYVLGAEVEPALREFGASLGRASCLIVPFVIGNERLGALVIASDSQDLSEPAWGGFAAALAMQFGQTIALGRFMARGAASEVRYQTLMKHASDAILLLDSSRVVIEANRQAEILLGRASEEIAGRPYRDFLVSGERDLLSNEAARVEGARLARPDGSSVIVDLSVAAVEVGEERLELVILHDVTERNRAEAELRRLQQRLHHVVSSSPAVLYTLRVDERSLEPTWVSSNIEQLTGYNPEEVSVADWWRDRLHPDDRERISTQTAGLFVAGRVQREYRIRRKDGAYRWIRDELRMLRDASGEPVEAVGSWWDVEELKQAELRLAESEEQYRLLFDSNPHAMWVYDAETLAFLAVNDSAIRSYGFSRDEFLAMTIEDIRLPEEVAELHKALKLERGARPGEAAIWKHWSKTKTVKLVEILSSLIVFQGRKATLVLASDVTEKVTLEGQLRQAQKMEAIGQLAGGIAHDFNNLLGVITGYTDLLLKDLGALHPGAKRAEQIRRAAERAAELTRQLLAFSRKQALEPKVLDLNAIVSDVEAMLRRLIGEQVQLVAALAPDLGRVKADPGQIQQVIMNLAVNARDAMPQGGSLVLQTANAELDEAYARAHADVRPGPHVVLTVSDSGHGMDSATMARIFEPFFTTKDPGKGTGLGLATVFGIVKQSGGHVTVHSEVGQGTTFRVCLPRVSDEAPPSTAVEPAMPLGPASETVLLVEDAEALREMIREILEQAGFTVLAAADPQEALNVSALHEGALDLVLTDVVMPGMGGRQMIDRLRVSRPGTQVLFMSGYSAKTSEDVVEPSAAFIQKPFTAVGLLQKLREVLDASR